MRYHFFIDFDGTITAEDVGYNFFKIFTEGRVEDVVVQYRRGEISAIECLQAECDIYNRAPAPVDKVQQFIESQKLTKGCHEFISFCRDRNIRLTVLSSGFDFYIVPILKMYGLEDLEVLSNETIIKGGRIFPRFKYYDKSLCRRCANCKGERIRELTRHGEVSVFVGDGHSDNHGAEAADIVFAKSFLASYLDQKGIKYFKYVDFYDVLEKFQAMSANGS